MGLSDSRSLNRRVAIGATLAASAGLALPRGTDARFIRQRGMFGGGAIQLEKGEATFSLFASRLSLADEDAGPVVGSIRWVDDATGLTLTSTQVTEYEELESDEGESYRISGMMSANDEGEFPFVLDVLDAGFPGLGVDSVNLTVSDGFDYTASGSLTSGDIQEVEIDAEIDTM